MKSLIRWSAALGVAGSILVGSLFSGRALALTEQQVVERLRPVPVFTLTDRNGAPLVATPGAANGQGNTSTTPVAGIFISHQDAQEFLDSLKQSNPQLAEGVQLSAVSLADAYNLAKEGQGQEQANQLRVAFIPAQTEVDAAKAILQQSGQNADQFRGVPLFVARADGQDGAYLTVKQNDTDVIPMFFTREQLQSVLDRLKEVQPQLAATMKIQVVNLEGLIDTLQTSDNQELNQILLVPSADSIEFIRSLQQGGRSPQAPGTTPPQNPQRTNQPQQNPAPRANPAPR